MRLTRKHFVAVAKCVADLKGQVPVRIQQSVAIKLADELRLTNPEFNRGRFMAAALDGGK